MVDCLIYYHRYVVTVCIFKEKEYALLFFKIIHQKFRVKYEKYSIMGNLQYIKRLFSFLYLKAYNLSIKLYLLKLMKMFYFWMQVKYYLDKQNHRVVMASVCSNDKEEFLRVKPPTTSSEGEYFSFEKLLLIHSRIFFTRKKKAVS